MVRWQDEILFSTDPIDLSELVQESAKLYAEATLAGGGGHRDQQHGNRHGGPVVQVRSGSPEPLLLRAVERSIMTTAVLAISPEQAIIYFIPSVDDTRAGATTCGARSCEAATTRRGSPACPP